MSLGKKKHPKGLEEENQSKMCPVKQMLELANKGINAFIMTCIPYVL